MVDKHINLFTDLKEFIDKPLEFPIIVSSRNNFKLSEATFSFWSTNIIATIHNNLRDALNTNSKFLILNFKDTNNGWIVHVESQKPTSANILFLIPCWFEHNQWKTFESKDYPPVNICKSHFETLKGALKVYEDNKSYLNNDVFTNAKIVSDNLNAIQKVELNILYFYYCVFYLSADSLKNSINPYEVKFLHEGWQSILSQTEFLSEKMKEVNEKLHTVKTIEKVTKEAESVVEELKNKFDLIKSNIPDEPKSLWEKEYKKLQYTPSQSPDYANTIEFLDLIINIPFNKYSANETSVSILAKILNESHYGMEKAKKTIIEHIALQKFAQKSFGETICLVGPPGTGKTTIANKVADALDRRFVKIALGGMADESEFRGHRRTYVSSEAGRLVNGLVKCETMDPVIVFDEVDKLAMFRGSPQDALLEILDPEQNTHFVDRYLSFPIDLSKVMFICTANYIEQIPDPLKDRMNIINVEGYTKEEQFFITKNFIIPKFSKRYHMDNVVSISDDIIDNLCKKEKTGMRDAERSIKEIYKKSAYTLLNENLDTLDLNLSNCMEKISLELKTSLLAKKTLGF